MAEIYWKRRWLNRKGHHSDAFVSAEVNVDRRFIDAGVTISDCSRQIHLALDIYNHDERSAKREYNNAIYKLDTLIEVLTDTRTAMQQAWESLPEADEDGNS